MYEKCEISVANGKLTFPSLPWFLWLISQAVIRFVCVWGGGGGVLPYISYVGTFCPIRCFKQGVQFHIFVSRTGASLKTFHSPSNHIISAGSVCLWRDAWNAQTVQYLIPPPSPPEGQVPSVIIDSYTVVIIKTTQVVEEWHSTQQRHKYFAKLLDSDGSRAPGVDSKSVWIERYAEERTPPNPGNHWGQEPGTEARSLRAGAWPADGGRRGRGDGKKWLGLFPTVCRTGIQGAFSCSDPFPAGWYGLNNATRHCSCT